MSALRPLLAYPLDEIDPQMNSNRDEGEARLVRLRALLISAKRTPGMEDLLVAESRAGLAALLAPRGRGAIGPQELEERHAALRSVMASKSPNAPKCCLLVPSVRTLSVAEADALDEHARAVCVPVRRSDLVALLDEAPCSAGASPKVVLTWPKATFTGAVQRAKLTVERSSSTSVRFTVESCTKQIAENLIASDIPEPILKKLFGLVATSGGPELATPRRLPRAANELPDCLQVRLASIAQNKLRLQVLVSAAGPEHTSRPLAFENMRLFYFKDTTRYKHPRVSVKAYMHTSSAACVCGAHNLAPIQRRVPQERFSGKSEVVVSFDMCGECLDSPTKYGGRGGGQGGGGVCPLHGVQNTSGHALVPGLCCAGCSVTLSCKHQTIKGDAISQEDGLWMPFPRLGRCAWLELTTVMAAVIRYDQKAKGLFGKDAPADAQARLAQLVAETDTDISSKVRDLKRRSVSEGRAQTDEDMLNMDMNAVDLLRSGGVSQAAQKSDASPRLTRKDGPELGPEEKRLAKYHHWLFPRPGQPCPKRKDRAWDAPQGSSSPPQGPSPPPEEKPRPEPVSKRPRPAGYSYESMVEYLDPAGFREMRRQIEALLANAALPKEQRERGLFFQRLLNAMDAEYGDEVDGPLGLPARPLKCKYRARNDGGRLYPYEMAKMQDTKKGEARSVCLQGAPREMRPFLCCRWGHDFDMKNAQPEMLYQMPQFLTWPDKRAPPVLPQLESWCKDRPGFIEHVAEVHCLASDEERWFEYRKDAVKDLMIRLMFGGQYEAWIRDGLRRRPDNEPRSPRVNALAKELAELRAAVFASHQWNEFYEKDYARLERGGKKEGKDEIERSVFARIAQKTENEVLTVMRKHLYEHGWTALTLCFDGLIVQHRPERTLDLAAMNARILSDTGYRLEVVEKPLFSLEFPTLSLDRSS